MYTMKMKGFSSYNQQHMREYCNDNNRKGPFNGKSKYLFDVFPW